MCIVRSASGHDSPIHDLKLASLRSCPVTSVHGDYGHLRLPSASTLSLTLFNCRKVNVLLHRYWGPVVTAYSLFQIRYGLRSRGVRHGSPFQLLAVYAVACWCFEIIGPFQYELFRTSTFTVGCTSSHCASPAFLPSHQAAHC